eukprot:261143_1
MNQIACCCDDCGRSFANRGAYGRHLTSQTHLRQVDPDNTSAPYKTSCGICNRVFKTSAGLASHATTHRQLPAEGPEPRQQLRPQESESTSSTHCPQWPTEAERQALGVIAGDYDTWVTQLVTLGTFPVCSGYGSRPPTKAWYQDILSQLQQSLAMRGIPTSSGGVAANCGTTKEKAGAILVASRQLLGPDAPQ